MKKRVVLVRHGDDPPDDRVSTWLHAAGFEIDMRKPFAGDRLGDVDETVAGTVLYGGPFSVFETDKHPFLKEEDRWIGACLKADIPMLGICQGAQQIAHHLGAWVGPLDNGIHEFGYYPIEPSAEAEGFLEAPLRVTQAHFHTFNLPDGAVRLAGSAAFSNQAFRYGERVFGFQFHPEVTIEGFSRWQTMLERYYTEPGAQTREEQNRLMLEHDAAQADWFYRFLKKLFGRAAQ
ncbi:MAG: glutamine amidotransferase [Pseudomonadota bacterium]